MNETKIAHLAIGRLLRMASRPAKEGDVREYHNVRALLMKISPSFTDYSPNYAGDYKKGAQGD